MELIFSLPYKSLNNNTNKVLIGIIDKLKLNQVEQPALLIYDLLISDINVKSFEEFYDIINDNLNYIKQSKQRAITFATLNVLNISSINELINQINNFIDAYRNNILQKLTLTYKLTNKILTILSLEIISDPINENKILLSIYGPKQFVYNDTIILPKLNGYIPNNKNFSKYDALLPNLNNTQTIFGLNNNQTETNNNNPFISNNKPQINNQNTVSQNTISNNNNNINMEEIKQMFNTILLLLQKIENKNNTTNINNLQVNNEYVADLINKLLTINNLTYEQYVLLNNALNNITKKDTIIEENNEIDIDKNMLIDTKGII